MELKIIIAIIATLYALIGSACLMWPDRLQALAIRRTNASTPRYESLARLIRSPRYIIFLQIVGAMSSSAAVALLLVLIKSARS
jgi:hypothetical protein